MDPNEELRKLIGAYVIQIVELTAQVRQLQKQLAESNKKPESRSLNLSIPESKGADSVATLQGQ